MIAAIFDTETTGLVENRALPLSKLPEVIEFYGATVDLDADVVIEELDVLIRPSRMPLPRKIVEITGITDADLDGKPSFGEVLAGITGLFSKADVVISHNASFDSEMLEIEAQRLGVELKLPRLLCSVEQTVTLTGQRLSLSALHENLFGMKFPSAHRARNDARALIRCCVELKRREVL